MPTNSLPKLFYLRIPGVSSKRRDVIVVKDPKQGFLFNASDIKNALQGSRAKTGQFVSKLRGKTRLHGFGGKKQKSAVTWRELLLLVAKEPTKLGTDVVTVQQKMFSDDFLNFCLGHSDLPPEWIHTAAKVELSADASDDEDDIFSDVEEEEEKEVKVEKKSSTKRSSRDKALSAWDEDELASRTVRRRQCKRARTDDDFEWEAQDKDNNSEGEEEENEGSQSKRKRGSKRKHDADEEAYVEGEEGEDEYVDEGEEAEVEEEVAGLVDEEDDAEAENPLSRKSSKRRRRRGVAARSKSKESKRHVDTLFPTHPSSIIPSSTPVPSSVGPIISDPSKSHARKALVKGDYTCDAAVIIAPIRADATTQTEVKESPLHSSTANKDPNPCPAKTVDENVPDSDVDCAEIANAITRCYSVLEAELPVLSMHLDRLTYFLFLVALRSYKGDIDDIRLAKAMVAVERIMAQRRAADLPVELTIDDSFDPKTLKNMVDGHTALLRLKNGFTKIMGLKDAVVQLSLPALARLQKTVPTNSSQKDEATGDERDLNGEAEAGADRSATVPADTPPEPEASTPTSFCRTAASAATAAAPCPTPSSSLSASIIHRMYCDSASCNCRKFPSAPTPTPMVPSTLRSRVTVPQPISSSSSWLFPEIENPDTMWPPFTSMGSGPSITFVAEDVSLLAEDVAPLSALALPPLPRLDSRLNSAVYKSLE